MAMKTSQAAVARLESKAYTGVKLATLAHVARALDARLVVTLQPKSRRVRGAR